MKHKKKQPDTIPTPPYNERCKRYLPYLLQGHGYKYIASHTKINVNTVKSDLRKQKNIDLNTPPPPPASKKTDTKDISPQPQNIPPVPQSKRYNWDGALDKIGAASMTMFEQAIAGEIACPHCGGSIPIVKDQGLAKTWADTFGRLFGAFKGSVRIDNMVVAKDSNVVLGDQSVVVSGLRERMAEYEEAGLFDDEAVIVDEEKDEVMSDDTEDK